ncbi:cell division protein ZapA, partial [Acidisphaera rubrifaciens]|uniref:cell division protein ZapA n=1 Tax=Acidisphaera rubrifaciens TaxID=50715 RepID=UPI0006624B5C
MALVTVKINGFPHTVGCQDGQEAHLQAMAAEVERRVQGLLGSGVGRDPAGGGETRLLALAALMLADELHDMRVELDH